MPVFFRTTGTMGGPSFFLKRRGGTVGTLRIPVTVAVVERPEGLLLIDTGWSRRACAFPDDEPGTAARLALGLDVKPEDNLSSQLLSLGLNPGDVRDVVATHLHTDHISGALDFPGADLHVSETEWGALDAGRLRGYDPALRTHPRVRQHALDGPAILGFSASRDLFGDGTVFLLDAQGHTRGSVAVAVQLDKGWLVHAGDAAMFAEDFRLSDDVPPSPYMRVMSWDQRHQRATWRHLREAEDHHGARVVVSHDPAQLEALPQTRETGWKTVWDARKSKRPNDRRKGGA